MIRRRPGRPARPALAREAILAAALELLEEVGLEGVTMRALARRLRVDPMAPYHYFPDRDALLREAASLAYARIDLRQVQRGGWRRRLAALATAYLAHLATAGELTRYLAARGDAAREPTRIVAAQFAGATRALALSPRRRRAAHDAFVDLVHGFGLGVPRTGLSPSLRARLREELAVLLDGMAHHLSRPSTSSRGPRAGRRRAP
jgi:AcrR family transcriptional regulator